MGEVVSLNRNREQPRHATRVSFSIVLNGRTFDCSLGSSDPSIFAETPPALADSAAFGIVLLLLKGGFELNGKRATFDILMRFTPTQLERLGQLILDALDERIVANGR